MASTLHLLPLATSLLLLLSLHASAGAHLHPLIIVPGTFASQIYARLTDAYQPSNEAICGANRPAGWFRLWKNSRLLREPLAQCYTEQMMIHYDAGLDDYRNTPGVETAAPYFGSVEGFRHREPGGVEDAPEIEMLLESLEAIGYRDGENLFGAPYDFRYGLAAAGHPSRVGSQYLRDLKALVEHAASANGGEPVVILALSLGGLIVHQLLTRNPLPWRRYFVRHLITVGTSWGGVVWAMECFASGIDVYGLDPSVMRAVMGTHESNLWVLPFPRVFGSRTVVATRHRNYTAADIPQFLADAGFPEAVHPYRSRILPLIARLDPPGIPVTSISGMGVPTREVLVYGDGFGRAPEMVFGDGDGAVTTESLLFVEQEWAGMPEQPLKVIKVPNASHWSTVMNEVALREIMEQVCVSSDVNSSILSFPV